MSERVQQIREIRRIDGSTARAERTVETETADPVSRAPTVDHADSWTVAARVVWFVAGILLVLLGFRFVFALLGANPANPFANFIYTVSHPFVAPFFSLFSYNLQYGVTRFEGYTLVAMAVYALIAYGIARLLTINRPAVVE